MGEGQDNISERIRRLRGKLGVTQPQLAQRLGIPFASVESRENGLGRPVKNVRGAIAALERRGLEALANSRASVNRDSVEASTLRNPPRIDMLGANQ